ncbi:PSD1 and planctomycete cytochrome C domain-containing protein [Singulisphaera sp. PoT]|uniref:PSD1 and planctomycete cytochrome C domain-containing protein n=1 Tax=Singulisphaera sp. PoT TaxID=3411797 RepID=UPI003BF5B57D
MLALLVGAIGLSGGVRLHAEETAAPENKGADPAAIEFFEKEVRPLLVSRCQQCHGDQKQKGELRLDTRESALAGGSTGPAVVPGKPQESLLVEAINYGDAYQMPPKSKLPEKEIATLTRWVELGAPWPQHGPTSGGAKVLPFDIKERSKHWSLQPVKPSTPPEVREKAWPSSPIDAYLLAALEAKGLKPAAEADKQTLIRRVTFDLTGVPPTPAEVEGFLADHAPDAYGRLVERLLSSPRYGERWGRHWLDLVRYAETSGHEFDYDVPDAFRYRDYVVRAFNADLPYDQLVREHFAGDQLNPPRRNPAEGFNESIMGTGFFFLGEGTHSPVDLLDDEATRVDNQIDVLSKAFLGLTIACARCHDHKFDAISTKDYYALYGYFQSSRHQHAFIDPPSRIADKAAALATLKESIRKEVDIPKAAQAAPRPNDSSILFEDFGAETFRDWVATGDAFGTAPTRSGDFLLKLTPTSAQAVPVASGQAHSGLVSDRLQGVLRSKTFPIERRFIHYLASGRGGRINLVVDGFEKIRSPIYGGLTTPVGDDRPRWYTQDVSMWHGHRAAIELSDGATVDYTGARSRYNDGSGYLAVDEIRFSDEAIPGPLPEPERPIDLPHDGKPALAAAVDEYRKLEASIPAPNLSLAIADGSPEDESVHIRGSSKMLGDKVPRRFLEALSGPEAGAYESGSGRLELAERLVDPANPLLARVMVNRIWKHHFGRGLVSTLDDFGKMGETPSHPELLDYLAARFITDGWSIKGMHRLLLLSSAYRMSSKPDAEADRVDPANVLLHRMNVRRLEAESIRDTLLAVSGRIDSNMFGPSVPTYLSAFMEGRGRPDASGPLDGAGRRSLYLGVRRNFLNPMFLAFDFPSPFSTMGRRNVSNVPAQALTLLNDPFVLGQAKIWAERLTAEQKGKPAREVVQGVYLTAFGRPPTDEEAMEAIGFLDEQAKLYGQAGDANAKAWADLCHVLMNVKEFIYVN